MKGGIQTYELIKTIEQRLKDSGIESDLVIRSMTKKVLATYYKELEENKNNVPA